MHGASGFVGVYDAGERIGEEQHVETASFVKTLAPDTLVTGDVDAFEELLQPFEKAALHFGRHAPEYLLYSVQHARP